MRGALLLGAVALAACGVERPPAPGRAAAPAAESAAAPVAQAGAVPAGAVAAPGAAASNPQARDSVLQTMAALEDSLRIHGEDSAYARLYLDLGRLKRIYERWLYHGLPGAEYAHEHQEEYRVNEVGANWLYNGYHFRELIRRFPQSPLAVEAAWELTLLSTGGECEGYVPCYIERGFRPVADFLRAYPVSPYADEAVRRADTAFTWTLNRIPDLTEPNEEHYPPEEVQALVARYDSIAQRLPLEPRARATLVIADLWARFYQRERARTLYQWLAESGAPGVDTALVRNRLQALSAPMLRLHPARVISDRRVDLQWEAPPGAPAGTYVVLRSAAQDRDGRAIAELPAGGPGSYSDRAAPAGGAVWYRVRARTPSGEVASNPVRASTPPDTLRLHALIWHPAGRMLYVFGFLANGFPRVLQVSERGELVAVHDVALHGIGSGAREGHKFDTYADEAWFVDPPGQAFLRFRKWGDSLGADLWAAVRHGREEVGLDLAPTRYFGITVSVSPDAREMWAVGGGDVSLSWDRRRGITWEGREGRVRVLDATGKVIHTIPLLLASPVLREFVTAIQADPRSPSAWAYLSRSERLLRIDSSGAVTASLSLSPSPEGSPVAMSFDLAHGFLWMVAGPWNQPRLTRHNLADGTTLVAMSGSYTDLPRSTQVAADTVSGGVWVLAGSRLLRFGPDGTRLMQATLPTR